MIRLIASAILAILACTALIKADLREQIKALHQICQKETNSTIAELDKFFKLGLKPAEVTEPVKCHMKCMMEKRGHFKNGVFDEKEYVKSMQMLPEMKNYQAEIAKVATNCKGEKGSNACETAFKIVSCLKNIKAISDVMQP